MYPAMLSFLTADLRASVIDYHNELQALGYSPIEMPVPDLPDISVDIDEKSVCIIMDGMLPFLLKGSAYYLHEKLETEIGQYLWDNDLPRLIFNEHCAVMFIHQYANRGRMLHQLRDYGNTECKNWRKNG